MLCFRALTRLCFQTESRASKDSRGIPLSVDLSTRLQSVQQSSSFLHALHRTTSHWCLAAALGGLIDVANTAKLLKDSHAQVCPIRESLGSNGCATSRCRLCVLEPTAFGSLCISGLFAATLQPFCFFSFYQSS